MFYYRTDDHDACMDAGIPYHIGMLQLTILLQGVIQEHRITGVQGANFS